jgi:hypothetical protein
VDSLADDNYLIGHAPRIMQCRVPLLLPSPALPIARECFTIAGNRSPSPFSVVRQLDPDRVVGKGARCRADSTASLNN